MATTTRKPHYDPAHEEWSIKTGPSEWLVWKHGTRPGDEERLLEALAEELARELEENASRRALALRNRLLLFDSVSTRPPLRKLGIPDKVRRMICGSLRGNSLIELDTAEARSCRVAASPEDITPALL